MKQKLKILLVGTDESIPTAGEFKILLSLIDRPRDAEVPWEHRWTGQHHPSTPSTIIGRILHSTMRYRHSARADMKQSLREPKFGAIQHMWTTKGIEITGTMLSDPSWLKLEIENRKIAGEMTREREIQQPTSKEDMGGRAGGWRDGWRRWRERRAHFFCWALRNVQNCGVMLYTWKSHYTVCQLCLNLKKEHMDQEVTSIEI